jgi:uncharacterized BrkB/YihY/UPF0761 family membrane protein
METGKTERFAKEIIAGSRLEITQPGFNNIVMQKIFLAERKKAMKRALLCWFFGLSSLGIILFLAVLSIYQNNASTVETIERFFQKAAQLTNENLFIIASLVVFFILYRIFNQKKISRYLPDLNFELS